MTDRIGVTGTPAGEQTPLSNAARGDRARHGAGACRADRVLGGLAQLPGMTRSRGLPTVRQNVTAPAGGERGPSTSPARGGGVGPASAALRRRRKSVPTEPQSQPPGGTLLPLLPGPAKIRRYSLTLGYETTNFEGRLRPVSVSEAIRTAPIGPWTPSPNPRLRCELPHVSQGDPGIRR